MHPPLLLTGGPAAGKSATSRRLVESLRRAAVIDVDDIRHLVVAGHAAPWEGTEGQRQQRIGVENACDLARRFLHEGVDVVLCDVISHETAALYRDLLARSDFAAAPAAGRSSTTSQPSTPASHRR